MTSDISTIRQSPQSIRDQVFAVRRRGLDEDAVREYLALLADQFEASERERVQAENERARTQQEMNSLRQELSSKQDQPDDEISDQAVILFSQAQQVADSLISEAVESARDLMTTARAQQRDIMSKAHKSAEAAASRAADQGGAIGGYDTPVPEVEYVRTYTQVAQIQLRAVLDALTEQVDKLGEVPNLAEAPTPTYDESWRFSALATGTE